MRKRVILSVTNDLATDQRLHKVALTLSTKKPYDILLVGRLRKDSLPVSRPYQTKRMWLFFDKGPLFYMEYNIRLFFFLLLHKADILVANDLDTLLPNFLISKLKRIPLVHDSHEYFTGVPELKNRPLVRTIWKLIEKFIFPKLKHIYTVNDSIADLYAKEYHRGDIKVIRNVPFLEHPAPEKTKEALGLPVNSEIILYQGAGINIDRGMEEMIGAMKFIENVILLIIGSGDVIGKLKKMSQDLLLQERVLFIPKVPFEQLRQYTLHADIGLSLDKDTNINYRFSLPNKLFDYIHAGVPVLASPLVEVKNIITTYDVGLLLENHNPRHIAERIKYMLNDQNKRMHWKENSKKAAQVLCWQHEEQKLIQIYEQVHG